MILLKTKMGVKKLKDFFLFLVLFVILLLWFVKDLGSYDSFNYDEAGYLSVSNIYFKLFFVDRDFSNQAWHNLYRTYGSPIPQIPKYIIGFSLYLFGYRDEDFDYFHFRWDKDLEWNKEIGQVPFSKVLYAARLPIAILGVLFVLLIFYTCRLMCGWKIAVIALLLTSLNPLVILLSRTVMLDIPFVFFSTLTIFLMFYFLKHINNKKHVLIFTVLIGLIVGFALGSKLLALIILLIIIIFFVTLTVFRKKLMFLVYLAVILLISMGVFVLSNPHLYQHPIKYTKQDMLDLISKELEEQKVNSPDTVFNSFFQKFCYVTKRALFKDFAPINSVLKLPLDILFFVIGLIALFNKSLKNIIKKHLSFDNLITIWVCITLLGITYWIPMDRSRYYLSLIPCIIVVECYGLNEAGILIKRIYQLVCKIKIKK